MQLWRESRVSQAGLAALQPPVSAPGLRAVCHLLMSSQGEAGPNPSVSQGIDGDQALCHHHRLLFTGGRPLPHHHTFILKAYIVRREPVA